MTNTILSPTQVERLVDEHDLVCAACHEHVQAERRPAEPAEGVEFFTATARSSARTAAVGCAVAALEGAWSAIRAGHGELPEVVIVLGVGGSGNGTSRALGHFAAMRWRTPEPAATEIDDGRGDGEAMTATQRWAEVFVGCAARSVHRRILH